MNFEEILVTSASGDPNVNCSIFDAKTGALLQTFKGGNSVRNGLSIVDNDYILSAIEDKSLLKLFTLAPNGEEKKMLVPGQVSCLVVSKRGQYCIVGIDKTIFIWETSSGALLLCLQYHSQALTCLGITSDDSYFFSGGKDGMVLVWMLCECVSEDLPDNLRPRFTWNDHAAEVTDMHVGGLGHYARVATSSKDMTCRLYDLENGMLMTTVHVDFAINAVTMDENEYFMFLGSNEGEIYRINLFSERDADVHYKKSDIKCSFIGHTKAITCLSVSFSGKYLVSGSEDHDCRLWDLTNFSIVRKVPQKGPVTNAFVALMPPGFRNEKKFSPQLLVRTFSKECILNRVTEAPIKLRDQKLSLLHIGSANNYFDRQVLRDSADCRDAFTRSNVSMESMCRLNGEMYCFALSKTANEIKSEIDSELSE